MDPLNKTNTGGRFDHHAGARKIAALVVFLLAAGLVLLGCQPVRLTHVLVGDRMVDSGEYAVVTVIRKDQPVRTVPGMEIRKGDTITTDANSWAVIEFDPNVRVILTPGTKVQVSSLRLIFGEILAVLEGYKKIFEVETEDSIAGPESTIFSVSKVPQGPTTVTVIQGVVKLSSPVQAWPATRVTQYKKAVTPPGRRPEILRMTKDEFNGIVEWANRVENKVRPETPVVLIPDLRMLSKEKAQALLEREGLRIGEIQPKISRPPQPLGTVVDQKPEPGSRVGRGTAVTIGVEVEPVQVPDLRNRPLSEARQILQRRGLVPGEVHWRITGSVPAERVLGHRPGGGEIVPTGIRVDLDVEEESVVVPNVIGSNAEAAGRVLAERRLVLRVSHEEITGRQPPRTILRQNPPAGERVRPGTEVMMVLEAVSVLVPNIKGMIEGNAVNALQQIGLPAGSIGRQITGTHPAGIVFHQAPEAGTRVLPGTPVNLVVEAPSVIVPPIVGMNLDQANQRLNQNQLRLGPVREELRDNVRGGEVLNQSPGPGQRVAPSTTVTVTIAVAGCRVPNLYGMSTRTAVPTLGGCGLGIGRVSEVESNQAPQGTIIGQQPPPGTLVRRGERVDITIAKTPLIRVPLPAPPVLHPIIISPQKPPLPTIEQNPDR